MFFWGIAETTGVVKNRMDLFDPYFDIIEKVGGKKPKSTVFVKI